MKNIDALKGWTGRIRKVLFLAAETMRSRLGGQSLRILFSATDTEAKIRRHMRFTRHRVVFADPRKVSLADFDVVVPLNMEDAFFLSDAKPTGANWLIPIPTRASMELCDDKSVLNDFLQKHGFQDYVPRMDAAASPPFILKTKIGVSSHGCHLIRNQADIEKFRAEMASDTYFTQRFVAGPDEFADHILFDGQRVVASLGVRYIFSHNFPIKGQDAHLRTSLVRCPYLELWASMLAAIGFRGLCCVNYKVVDGQPMLLEINPRCGASLASYFFTFLRKIPVPAGSGVATVGGDGASHRTRE